MAAILQLQADGHLLIFCNLILVTCAVSHAHVAHSTAVLPSTCTLIQLSLTTLLEHWQPSTLGMKKDVGLAKESARPSEGLSVYADSSDTEEVSGRGWLLEHWQPSTLGVLILRKLSLTLLEHWQPSTLGMKKLMM